MFRKSVSSITSGLTKMAAQLERHAVGQQAEADFKVEVMKNLQAQVEGHAVEASKARQVAAKISALVS